MPASEQSPVPRVSQRWVARKATDGSCQKPEAVEGLRGQLWCIISSKPRDPLNPEWTFLWQQELMGTQ